MSKAVRLYYAGLFLLALGLSIAIGSIAPGAIIFGIGVLVHAIICAILSL